jgi:hypothetical protein
MTFGNKKTGFSDIEKMFEEISQDKKLTSESALKALIKTYTAEAVYREIGSSLVNGNYHLV